MSYENFEAKRYFVTRSLNHCVSEMFPRVVRLEYAFRVNECVHGTVEEVRIIHQCGYTDSVDVTGLELYQTGQRVVDALVDREGL